MAQEDSITTALLYLHILRSIPKRRKTTVREIHSQLQALGYERTERSIQRTMNTLCEHFDIECDMQSKPYGYRWKSAARSLDIPAMNEAESLLLLLADRQLQGLLPANIYRALAPFFEQAKRTLGEHSAIATPEQQWLDKVAVVPTAQPLLPAPIDDAVFDAVSSALYQNRWLEVDYQNQKGQRKTARVMPLALVQQGPTTYLVVRFDGYHDTRHLALHRILAAKTSTMTFTRPADFNLQQHLDDASFGFGRGNKIRLTFSISHSAGYHLTETPLSADQQILTTDAEHYRIRATVVDSAMLDWWLAKFGDEVWEVEKISLDSTLGRENA